MKGQKTLGFLFSFHYAFMTARCASLHSSSPLACHASCLYRSAEEGILKTLTTKCTNEEHSINVPRPSRVLSLSRLRWAMSCFYRRRHDCNMKIALHTNHRANQFFICLFMSNASSCLYHVSSHSPGNNRWIDFLTTSFIMFTAPLLDNIWHACLSRAEMN